MKSHLNSRRSTTTACPYSSVSHDATPSTGALKRFMVRIWCVLGAEAWISRGGIRKTELVSGSGFTGMHTWDDAFFWAPRSHGEGLVISDLRRIIVDDLLAG